MRTDACGWSRSAGSLARRGRSSTRRPSALPRSTRRTLSQRELNCATLARQLLLRRSRLSVPKAVERVCAMQAQAPNAPYIGLWSRLEGFDKAKLTRALERRQVTRSTLFRMTVHLVAASNQPAFARLMHDQWRGGLFPAGAPPGGAATPARGGRRERAPPPPGRPGR